MLTDVAAREAYHVLLLEYLLGQFRDQPAQAFVLKGGVNLRLFFGSPRYSQDIDFDADLRLRDTLRATIRAGLKDPKLLRQFIALGGDSVRVPGAAPYKDSETTLRFKFGVVGPGGIDLPTKIEVSFRRRPEMDVATPDGAPEALVDPYRATVRLAVAAARGGATRKGVPVPEEPAPLPPLVVPHYRRLPALRQKIGALAGRNEVQARDIFDLGILGALEVSTGDAAALRGAIADSTLREAQARTLQIPYSEYRNKVLAFLDEPDRERFAPAQVWDAQCLLANELVTRLLSLPDPGAEPEALPPYEEDAHDV